ncbi:hypothetical protein VB715_18880 [Crocosphaera sp. UHCC 0190]|uniref:hypothetical protein n=1 Tax=Crocosphaera sp. UHCC 0190 TaxID=3110246 RepID=UPI002B221551|nr:hypothetical protein [Crocosphaera sp. UHCC 0190]MEA5511840.1 hypothetical protein [Crocosphaera sp. UHCC 0190]
MGGRGASSKNSGGAGSGGGSSGGGSGAGGSSGGAGGNSGGSSGGNSGGGGEIDNTQLPIFELEGKGQNKDEDERTDHER